MLPTSAQASLAPSRAERVSLALRTGACKPEETGLTLLLSSQEASVEVERTVTQRDTIGVVCWAAAQKETPPGSGLEEYGPLRAWTNT